MRYCPVMLPVAVVVGWCAGIGILPGLVQPAAAQTVGAALDLDARAPAIGRWQLWRLMWSRPRTVLLDAREPDEFAASHLPGAHRVEVDVDKEAFSTSITAWARSRTVVLYCTTSTRSQVFADAVLHPLTESGAARIVYLEGGLIAWRDAGLPLVSRLGPTRRVKLPTAGDSPRSGTR